MWILFFRRAVSRERSVLSGHYGVWMLDFFTQKKIHRISKNSKMRACFRPFWATLIFETAYPPPPTHTFSLELRNSKTKACFSTSWAHLDFGYHAPPHPTPWKWTNTRFGLMYVWNRKKKFSEFFFKVYCIPVHITDEPSCMPEIISITHVFKWCVTILTGILVYLIFRRFAMTRNSLWTGRPSLIWTKEILVRYSSFP